MTRQTQRRFCAAAALAVALSALAAGPLEARRVHRHARGEADARYGRALLVRGGGLLPGTYPADYGQPGYGCRTSILAGNIGGCGTGWAYEGGPGFGYR